MTTPDTERLRKLAAEATPGPWHPHPAGKYVWTEELGGIIQNWSDDANAVADVEFIAAAREAVPALLDRIARLEAQADIRGRAVVMYRDRVREAEARIRYLAQEVLDERGAALDQMEQVQIRDARIKAVQGVLDQKDTDLDAMSNPPREHRGVLMADIRRALDGDT